MRENGTAIGNVKQDIDMHIEALNSMLATLNVDPTSIAGKTSKLELMPVTV